MSESEDVAAPYQATWNTTLVANTLHTLTAVARDAAGNLTTSAARSVTVNNVVPDTTPPVVSLTAPAAGSTVSGAVAVTANASDNVSVAGVSFFDGVTQIGAEDTTSPYSVSWTTTTAANGGHSLTAKARDAAGNLTVSAAMSVTVNNAAPGPSAVFVRADTTTKGTWLDAYGRQGYTLANGAASPPAFAAVTLTGQAAFTWNASTTDVRALQHPLPATDRFAATWYDNATFSIDVNITDGLTHQVAVYLVDWDSTIRAERIDVVDAVTGTVLDSRTVSGFNGGQYIVWNVSGHVTLRVTRTGGDNAVISALLFD